MSSNKGVHASTSAISFNLPVPLDATNGLVELDYTVSSERGWDNFFIHIDDVQKVKQASPINGAPYHSTFSSAILPGTHVMKLSYTKDGSSSHGDDAVYVTSIRLSYDANETSNALPMVKSIIIDRIRISDEPGVNRSIITVQFDQDVTEYVARLDGVDYSTGILVHQGGMVSANTDAQVIIDWDELTNEGMNKINIYGKSVNGWTIQEI